MTEQDRAKTLETERGFRERYMAPVRAMGTPEQVARGLALVVDMPMNVGDTLDITLVQRWIDTPDWSRSIVPPCVVRAEDIPALRAGEELRVTYHAAGRGLEGTLVIGAGGVDMIGFNTKRKLDVCLRAIAKEIARLGLARSTIGVA